MEAEHGLGGEEGVAEQTHEPEAEERVHVRRQSSVFVDQVILDQVPVTVTLLFVWKERRGEQK